ncbi:MAG: cache domain-containing protein [Desulfobacterales bacterium]|nr:cache domain-containing protein [Desulfobacterales bacterium]
MRKFLSMISSTHFKLVISLLGISFLVGGISIIIGGHLLYKAVLKEATDRIRLDLNAAHGVYNTQIKYVKGALNITTLGEGFRNSLFKNNIPDLLDRLNRLAQNAEIDFAGIVGSDGSVLCRIGPNSIPEDKRKYENPIVMYATKNEQQIAGTVVLSEKLLKIENPELANKIRLPQQNVQKETEPIAGLAIAAAMPIFENRNSGKLYGVIYGGILLNQSTSIVDAVRKTLFLDDMQQGQSTLTATIFYKDIRIATNLFNPNGKRAIGTIVSPEVKQRVLLDGKYCTIQDFIVSDRYIAGYDPIEDIEGKRVGIIGVGVIESNYSNVRYKFIFIVVIITFIGIISAVVIGYILGHRILDPLNRLIKASQEVSAGNLTPDIGTLSHDSEIRFLQKTFKDMFESLKQQRAESENQLVQSEKLASIGRLAAGVAHEINNPLTGVLTYTHMLLRRKDLDQEVRSDLQVVIESTERVRKIVKGLLDFSRQTELDLEPMDLNRLVKSTIALIENQALLKGIQIDFNPASELPMVTLDRSQMNSVLLNIIINAIDATGTGGHIDILTTVELSTDDAAQKGVKIVIADTGSGIPPENLDKLFDPFFTTKEVGKGTGLGLSVSYGIVKRHGGLIRVQSEVGKGTKFLIWLPIEKKMEVINENYSS